jgi:hypothetical protein
MNMRKMMDKQEDRTEKEVVDLLEYLQETPPRNPESAAHGRANFLAEVDSLRKPVSVSPFRRLKGWIPNILVQKRKERRPMLATISAIVIALALVVSGGGVTAYAAQDSLPNDALYPAKLFFEDVQLGLTFNPESKVELLTHFANRRVDESLDLASQGEAVPQKVVVRLEKQLKTMLQVTAQMDDETMLETMNRIRNEFSDQGQLMMMLGMPDTADPQLLQLKAAIREQHQVVLNGLEDVGQFQTQFRYNRPTEVPTETPIDTEIPDDTLNGNIDCQDPDCEPVATGEPGVGPGPGNCEVPGECTPEENGLGPGPGPNSTATVVPGSNNPGNGKKP